MGNENSQQLKYGAAIDNSIKLKWNKLDASNSSVSRSFSGRDGHCSCSSVDKCIYVFGGILPSNNSSEEQGHEESNDLLCYSIDNTKWKEVKQIGDIPAPRCSATIAGVGKNLYLFGGLSHQTGWFEDVHCFNTETCTWSKIEPTGLGPTPRDKLASAVIDDKIYLFGGFGPQGMEEEYDDEEELDEEDDLSQDEGAQFGWFNDLYIFDPATNSWSSPMQMNLGVPTPRAAHGMCAVNNNLVIFGGKDSTGRLNDIHIFDTVTRKWAADLKVKGRQPEPRSFHTVTAVDTRVVVMGGRGLEDQHFGDCHIFDTETHEWLQPAVEGTPPAARALHSATRAGNVLVVYGGSADFNRETQQCSTYFNDTFVIQSESVLMSGASAAKSENKTEATETKAETSESKTEATSTTSGVDDSGETPAKKIKQDE